ncbi:hypothetical protein DM02DRAFT_634099 [Periconia macrospinosa]|uniref:Uncharacterized protein n=1 Tax=Periconia macrospinosa TaxID=97972 RepID=A0A2V1D7E5_9PLEO|nr:hypothetical protein DM02DRAFT_634099 [Periconia macrospinosa]
MRFHPFPFPLTVQLLVAAHSLYTVLYCTVQTIVSLLPALSLHVHYPSPSRKLLEGKALYNNFITHPFILTKPSPSLATMYTPEVQPPLCAKTSTCRLSRRPLRRHMVLSVFPPAGS